MKNEEFIDFVKIKKQQEEELFIIKGNEYTINNDRFHNFKISKYLYDLITNKDTMEFVFFSKMVKQIVSVIDILNGKTYTKEILSEKFGDIRVYLLLLEAYLLEKLNSKKVIK